MNEYRVKTTGRAVSLMWFANTAKEAQQEATDCGHKVVSVSFVRESRVSNIAPGVVCKCGSPGAFCPAHGILAD